MTVVHSPGALAANKQGLCLLGRRAWEVMLWSCWGAAGEPRTGTAQKKHFEQGELRKEVLTTENAQSKECSGQWVLRTRSAQDRAHRTRSA
eukprot:scaffold56934_cov23-Tisochrysis_lutea.AAC.1